MCGAVLHCTAPKAVHHQGRAEGCLNRRGVTAACGAVRPRCLQHLYHERDEHRTAEEKQPHVLQEQQVASDER